MTFCHRSVSVALAVSVAPRSVAPVDFRSRSSYLLDAKVKVCLKITSSK